MLTSNPGPTHAKFWMVWCPSYGTPTHPHPTQTAARAEAERLARKHRGHRFIVLEALSSVTIDEAQWKELEVEMAF